jgi:enoyl-CoA hydratase/carnithine racemase
VNRIAAAGGALEAALTLARVLASKPALSLSLVRAAARDSLCQDVDTATQRTLEDSHRVFAGPDIAEGVDAFFAKRPPRFSAPRNAQPDEAP